ncbi:GATA zinc finger domain-containing protein 14 [Nilaparvata lugens]|uniref:GATA zinc finger domain-containing protein 14 n=1 Tax=Nilaparvata lugens TaxID=108931 RepID=UPI00193E3BE4|nr:GATA zinc finger domain-containing protein 14 [Nilaparvata lugens]
MGVDIKSDDWNEASTTKTQRNIDKINKMKDIDQQKLGDSQNSTQTSKNKHEQFFEDFSSGDCLKENSKFPPKNSGVHKVQNCDRGDEIEKKNVLYDENRNFDNKNSDNRNFDNKNSDNRNFDYKNCGFDYNEQISKDRDHGFQDNNDSKKNTKNKNEGFISGRNNSNHKNQEYCECRKNLHPEDDNGTDFYNKIELGEYLHNKKHEICDDKNVIHDKRIGIFDDKSSIHDKNHEAFNNKKQMHDKQHGISDNKNRKPNKKHEMSDKSLDSNSLHHHSNKSDISKNNPKLSQNPRSVTPQNLSDISDNCLRFSSDSDGLSAGRRDVSLSDKNINSDYIQGRDLSLSDKNTGSKRDSENVPATLSDRGRKGNGGRSDDLRVSDDKFVGERKRDMSLSDGLKLEKRRGEGPVNKKPSVSDKRKRDKSLINKKQSLSDQFDNEKIKEKLLINKKQSLSDNFDYERSSDRSIIDNKQSLKDQIDYEKNRDTSLINKNSSLSDNFDYEKQGDTSLINKNVSLTDQFHNEVIRDKSLINKKSSLSDNFDYEKHRDTSLINTVLSLSDDLDFSRRQEIIQDYHTATCSSVSFGFSCSKGCYGRKEYWKQEYEDGTCSQSSKTDGRCRCDEEEEEDGEEEEREKERGKERSERGDAPHKVPSDTNQSLWEQQKLRPGTVRRRKKQIGIGVRFSYYVPNRFCPRSGRVDAAHKPVQEYCRCAEKKAPPIEAPSAHTKSGSGDLSSQRPSTSDDDKAPRRKSVTLLPDKADQLDADNDAYLRIVDQNKKVSDWLEPDTSSKAATNETETISFLNAKDPIPSQMGFEGSMVAEEEDAIQKKPKYTLARSRSDPDVIYIRKTVCDCCEGANECIKIYKKHNDFEVHGSYMELPNCEPVDKDVFESIFEYLNPCRYLN